MATHNVTALNTLLDKRLLLTENVFGIEIERSGVCTAFVITTKNSCCDAEFLLEQDDGDVVFYSLDEVTIHSIE
jgi:hypothetical protein